MKEEVKEEVKADKAPTSGGKSQKVKAPEKERQGPQYEGDVNAYKSDPANWGNLSRVAKDYGWQFLTNDKAITFDNIPQPQLRQAVTIAELYRTRKLR